MTEQSTTQTLPDCVPDAAGVFDLAVIGAGVVGCAVARRFALAGARVVVLEKGADLLCGASKANSAILHTGFDAPEHSLEHALIQAGREEYLRIAGSLNLALLPTGALVCAWDAQQAEALTAIEAQGRRNGVPNLRRLTAREARRTMPQLSDRLVQALEVADEHVIDPWSAPLAYLTQAQAAGAVFLRRAEVLGGRFDARWRLQTSRGTVQAAALVNAAGLFGDVVDARLGLPGDFRIQPRKGQFVVLDKVALRHVPRIVLPVPTAVSKGIVVCPTVFGNVLVGPTAEEQDDRLRATVHEETLKMLLDKAAAIVPALAGVAVTAVYAGLRPATQYKDYRVTVHAAQCAMTLGGIRSTGLSAALGLAQHALTLYAQFATLPRTAPVVPQVQVPNLAEHRPRDWQADQHGDIVCHCELVTRREILAALASPVPPGDLGGLRRRTRAGMGRCQGFYCHAQLTALAHGRLATPVIAAGTGAAPR